MVGQGVCEMRREMWDDLWYNLVRFTLKTQHVWPTLNLLHIVFLHFIVMITNQNEGSNDSKKKSKCHMVCPWISSWFWAEQENWSEAFSPQSPSHRQGSTTGSVGCSDTIRYEWWIWRQHSMPASVGALCSGPPPPILTPTYNSAANTSIWTNFTATTSISTLTYTYLHSCYTYVSLDLVKKCHTVTMHKKSCGPTQRKAIF